MPVACVIALLRENGVLDGEGEIGSPHEQAFQIVIEELYNAPADRGAILSLGAAVLLSSENFSSEAREGGSPPKTL